MSRSNFAANQRSMQYNKSVTGSMPHTMKNALPGLWMTAALAAAAFAFASQDTAEAALASAVSVFAALSALKSLEQRELSTPNRPRDSE